MNKRPISIILDDPAPGIHVYYHHIPEHLTSDGRPLLKFVPNTFLNAFCDVIQKHGIKGKFSAIPMAGCQGSMKDGFNGVTKEDVDTWIRTVKNRIMPNFAICSELLTHHYAYDMKGGFLSANEQEWVASHSEDEITDYIALSLQLLNETGLTPTGVTSPWMCGIECEDVYASAISRAFKKVFDRNESWYFLHTADPEKKDTRPLVTRYSDGRSIAHIYATFHDEFWQCIHTPDTSEEFIHSVADRYITEDGSDGLLIRQLEGGTGWPVLLTHWQSQFSNGLWTGLKALDIVGDRINKYLSSDVEWTDFTQIMKLSIG